MVPTRLSENTSSDFQAGITLLNIVAVVSATITKRTFMLGRKPFKIYMNDVQKWLRRETLEPKISKS